MFWDKWIPAKYLIKSEVGALEYVFTDNTADLFFTQLKSKNKKVELLVTNQIKDLSEIEKTLVKQKIPLVLVLNGKGVIYKKIILQETETTIEEIVTQNLPALNTDEFYIQLYKQENGIGFLSLCRKQLANTVINEIKLKKIDIANLYIGTPSIIGLQPLWNNFNTLPTSTHIIELTNGRLENITTEKQDNQKVKIDDLEITSNYTIGFAAGLNYFTQIKINQNLNHEIVSINKNHTEKNKLRFLMIAMVAIAFIAAVTNLVFYTNYFNKNNQLETELSVYQGKYEQINQLLNDYQKKKDLIENAGILTKNKLSEYADKIAVTLPDEVLLTEFYFNPKIENDESEDSLVVFNNKKIILKGNCNKSLIINEWVNVLKMQNFIKEVVLEKFAYNQDGILPNFEIKIETK